MGRLRKIWEGNFREAAKEVILDPEDEEVRKLWAGELTQRWEEAVASTGLMGSVGSGLNAPWAQSGGNAGSQLAASVAAQLAQQSIPRADPYDPHILAGMINSRMRANPGMFEYMLAHYLGDDRYVVFIINKGQYTAIEDGAMFPSDNLITKLRLLAE